MFIERFIFPYKRHFNVYPTLFKMAINV